MMEESEQIHHGRMQPLIAALGEDVVRAVVCARVLVVGAGGIGCELIKDLVMTGFTDLEVLDLDTIDVSNLNRQFLFRPHHVGRSKAEVAKEAAQVFNPRASIIAHHANIKETAYGVSFVKRFNLVINALDNVSARRHVNRLCLAADVPLIEAGTQGYLGQTFPIRKGVTECFECQPKATPKKFPICTIRSTPDKPVHCVVWAKEFHKLLFGDAKTSYLYEADTSAESEGGAAAASGRGESVYMHLVQAAPAADARTSDTVRAWARSLCDAIFHDEIVKRLEMSPDTYKTMKSPPVALRLADIESGVVGSKFGDSASAGSTSKLKDQQVLSLLESAKLLVDSVVSFLTTAETASAIGSLEFSKDSPLDLDFVTAATNLRAFTFGIPMQSRWDVKSIAGNIIPAIATTNAIVAGMEVLEAIKILRGDDIAKTGSYTNVLRKPAGRGWLLMAAKLAKPNSNCYVCGTQGVSVFIDTNVTTLQEFMDKVLKGSIGFNLPNIDNGDGFNFLEEREDGETDEEYQRKMSWMATPMAKLVGGGLRDGMVIHVEDFSQDLSVSVHIVHREQASFDELKHPMFFEITGESNAAQMAAELDKEVSKEPDSSRVAPAPMPAAGSKRRRDDEADAAASATMPLNGAVHETAAPVGDDTVKKARMADGPRPAAAGHDDDDVVIIE